MSTLFFLNLQSKWPEVEARPNRRGTVVNVPEVPFHYLILGAINDIAKNDPELVAFNHYDNPDIPNITYAEVKSQCQKLSRFFTHEKMLHKGEVAAICLPNSYHFAVYFLGVASVGGVTTGFSHKAKPSDWVYQLNNSESRVLLTNKHVFKNLRKVFGQLRYLKNVILLDAEPDEVITQPRLKIKSWYDVLQAPAEFNILKVKIDPKEDLLVLPYSSGTTGRPKGVMITHYNYVAQVISYKVFTETQISVHLKNFGLDFNAPTFSLLFSPFYHAMGFFLLCAHLYRGHTMIIFANLKMERFLQAITEFKPRIVSMVPSMFSFFIKSPLLDKYDVSSILNFGCGGSALTAELSEAFYRKFPNCKIINQAYGLTEMTCAIASSPFNAKVGSAGIILPNISYRIVHPKTKKECGHQEPGELWCRGPTMMKGYWKNTRDTKATITKDGWLKTGDLVAEAEDGQLFIVGRLKELIKVNAFQVAPAELEDLIHQHPLVEDVAVIGVPDPVLGEKPRAYIIRKSEKLKPQEVFDYVAERVTPYKKLVGGVEFVEKIPRNESGKIMRRMFLASYMVNHKPKL
ncbi:unnamed protein product [Bursaphelenchus okinawaensis]|uniref:AMP-binding domain-containing protein n=1 Tax=Bursaphelenchus okinawaensis TaxID=465554 RepID=A0A811K3W3_9BILA|nr:unnamed protein product [Bursaphelenchus okinawaensis]CAG9090106.1 unnamed protein product [Bursaphelenchus okinawaensis]